MALSLPLIIYGLTALAAVGGLIRTIKEIPFPQKFVWLVGFGILFANGLCNALYQYGGIYIVLLPALIPLQSTIEVTATMGLLIGAYSFMNKDQISPHWYSLPTGCTPVTMIAQYYPTYYIQMVMVAAFAIYVVVKQRDNIVWLLPFAILLGSAVVRAMAIKVGAALTTDDLAGVLLLAATVVLALMCTSGKLEAKLKAK